MAVIPQGITAMVGSVLSYLVFILTILVIVKIIQTIMDIGGFGSGSGKGGSGDGGSSPKTKSPKQTREEQARDKYLRDNIDPSQRGEVRFLVKAGGNPVPDVQLKLTPVHASKNKYALVPAMKFAKWTLNKDTWREYEFITDPEGFAPSADSSRPVASGFYKISIKRTGYKPADPKKLQHIEIIPGDQVIPINLEFADTQTQPRITSITEHNDNLILEGEIV